jgi:hypothetical protein
VNHPCNSESHTLRLSLAFSIVLCFHAATMQAQTPLRATFHGVITDPSGAVVPGASVELDSLSGSRVAKTVTSPTGRFEFRGISQGSYTVVVPPVHGFAAYQTAMTIDEDISSITITLQPQVESESVTASADESASSDGSSNRDAVAVTGSAMERLPVFDQDYVSALTPFLDPASSASDGITIMVNGIEMKASIISPSAIAEVQINNDPYSAEYSRPGRGRINIIPKPGSPEFQGELNFISRDATFNASNYFAIGKPPEQRRIYEGNLTGPLGTSRHTTFIFSGNRREEDTDAAVHASGPSGLIETNVPTPTRNEQVSMNVGHDFSDQHRVSLGYNFELQRMTNSGVGGLVLAEAGTNLVAREDDILFSDRIILKPNLLHQIQLFFEKDEEVTKSVTDAPAIQVQDSFTGGGAQGDIARTENTLHITEVVSWTRGKHYLRFGADVPQSSRRALDDHTNRLETFGFASIADFVNSNPYVWTAQQGTGRGLYWINETGAFIQDEISIRKNLRFTAGLRYQWQTYITDNDDFAPRLSMAWSVNDRTTIRAGSGMFYDRTGGDFPGTFKVHNGIVLHSVQVLNPGFPSSLPSGVSIGSLPSSIVREAPGMRAPYSMLYSLDVERQARRNLTITIGYHGILGVSTFRSRDANAPLPSDYSVSPDSTLGFVQQIESGGRLLSNALEVTVRSKANQWFTGQGKYTLSRAHDNTGGINWYPQNQYAPNDEWGRSSFDQLQRFNLIGNVHPDHWLTLGLATALHSGAPYTETAGADIYHTGLSNARPAGVRRNTLRGAGAADLDLLWDHDLHVGKKKPPDGQTLNFGVSAFNVFNHPNFTTYAGSVQSQLFRQPTTALAGRQLQFGIRYSF